MVTISVGRSDFYDPGVALRQAIVRAAEDELQTGECRSVDPTAVVATPPGEIPNSHRLVHFRLAMKRVPRDFIVMWKWQRERSIGWFFMYSERVLFVGWAKTRRWFNKVVPPEGLSVAELSNP
jgi:hypothetical protein